MRSASAADVYRRTIDGYLPTGRSGTLNFYQAISALEFQLRFIALLATAVGRTTGVSAIKIPRSLGFGTLQSILQQIHRDVVAARTPLPQLQQLTEAVTGVLGRSIRTESYGHQSLKRLRDLASHGAGVPADVNLQPIMEELSQYVELFLASAELIYTPSSFEIKLAQAGQTQEIQLSPLFFVDGANNLGVFWRYTNGRATYSLHSHHVSEFIQRDEESLAALTRMIVPIQASDPVRLFYADAGKDLAAFSEAGTTPVYYDDETTFTYFWKFASSADAVDRHDTFRLGPDHVREWLSPEGSWVGYSKFLVSITNWTRVAHRLYHKYVDDECAAVASEMDSIGWSFSNVTHAGPTSVKLMDLGGRTLKNMDFSELMERVDEDLGSVMGQTEIVFVTGEAGIGKTQALFNAAKDRARAEADNESPLESVRPLYLYVRASGNVLADLSESIAAAVNATRGLTEEAVAALCRNGLMALLIDGFDELLGGTAYSDALGSLRTWLERLGGRGVTVVSARSSYYLNQYRRSVRKAELAGQLAVYHRVAQLQPWSESKLIQHLRQLGFDSHGVHRLKSAERRLLRLPFFLRVYAQMLVEADRFSGDPTAPIREQSLLDFLLGNYLARESLKLRPDGAEAPLVSDGELEQLFEYCAEIMSTRAEHFLESEDLELAAEMVISPEFGHLDGFSRSVSV